MQGAEWNQINAKLPPLSARWYDGVKGSFGLEPSRHRATIRYPARYGVDLVRWRETRELPPAEIVTYRRW